MAFELSLEASVESGPAELEGKALSEEELL